MGIMDFLFGDKQQIEARNEQKYIERLRPLNEELKSGIREYIGTNFGKPYISVESIIRASKLVINKPTIFCDGIIVRWRQEFDPEDRELITDLDLAEDDTAEKEPASTVREKSSGYSITVGSGGGAQYSISDDVDRERLAMDADLYYSSVKNRKGGSRVNPLYGNFADLLIEYINRSGMTNVEVYKRANLSKSVFSSIMSDREHIPKKGNIVALAIALRLDLKQAETLLMKAGYTFSNTIISDLIAVYFITNQIYDIDKLNSALYDLGQPILGSRSY